MSQLRLSLRCALGRNPCRKSAVGSRQTVTKVGQLFLIVFLQRLLPGQPRPRLRLAHLEVSFPTRRR
jgi:hypothetical protein